jgi:hypothetical protein
VDDPPTPDPTSLRNPFSCDHRRLEDLLGSVVQLLEAATADGVARVWNEFREGLARHMHAEESTVIPGLTRMDPREVRVLLEEHRHLRRRCAELSTKIERGGARPEAVRAFADELRAHASHETRTLYASAETELDASRRTLAVASLGESPADPSR